MFSRGFTRAVRLFSSCGCLFLICQIIVPQIAASAQTNQSEKVERSLAVPPNVKVTLADAQSISVEGWDKNEISIEAETTTHKIAESNIKIDSTKDKVGILCLPSDPGQYFLIKLHMPTKSTLQIETDKEKIEVKEPNGRVSFALSVNRIEVTAPPAARLDLTNIRSATKFISVSDLQTVGESVGYRVIGNGPPYIKFASMQVAITINRPAPTSVTIRSAGLQPRQLTIAAQMIAHRNSMMSAALRKSEPRLQSEYKEASINLSSKSNNENEDVKLQTRLVNLSLGVTDRQGRAVPNLKQEDFSVYEDGVLQSITHFSPEQTPFNLVLLLDMSGSTRNKRDLIKEAALHFIDQINPQDKVAVVVFTTDVIVLSHLTQDRDDIRDAIGSLVLPTGGTSFYDALGYSLVEELRKSKGQRNAIVVLTDGEDNAIAGELARERMQTSGGKPLPPLLMGSFLSFDELLDGVKEADAMIYPIHLDTSADQAAGAPPIQWRQAANSQAELSGIAKDQLQQLADASGGRVFNADKIEDLKGIYEQVAAELRTVYSVAYAPTNQTFDGRFRRIVVKINQPPDSVARTRKGYYAR